MEPEPEPITESCSRWAARSLGQGQTAAVIATGVPGTTSDLAGQSEPA
jgi:hypothetical protein